MSAAYASICSCYSSVLQQQVFRRTAAELPLMQAVMSAPFCSADTKTNLKTNQVRSVWHRVPVHHYLFRADS